MGQSYTPSVTWATPAPWPPSRPPALLATWPGRLDEGICELAGSEPLPLRKCLRQGFLARPGQVALTTRFATWEGPGPSDVANVVVMTSWLGLARPGQFALTKTLDLGGPEPLSSRKYLRQRLLAGPGQARDRVLWPIYFIRFHSIS